MHNAPELLYNGACQSSGHYWDVMLAGDDFGLIRFVYSFLFFLNLIKKF